MFKRHHLSPLLHAVIENNFLLVSQLYDTNWQEDRDKYGFNALEIAYLLNRKECQRLLHPCTSSHFLFQDQYWQNPVNQTVEEIEALFQLNYCHSLTFSSYADLEIAIGLCPYLLRIKWLASYNDANTTIPRSLPSFLQTAYLSIKWIDEQLGYGLFIQEDCKAGTYIAEYTGHIRFINEQNPDLNAYCLEYPVKAFCNKYAVVDALKAGNITRFINHSYTPNLDYHCIVDRGLLHQVFIANQALKAGMQLTCDYGTDYWQRRKQLTNSNQEPSRFAKLL